MLAAILCRLVGHAWGRRRGALACRRCALTTNLYPLVMR